MEKCLIKKMDRNDVIKVGEFDENFINWKKIKIKTSNHIIYLLLDARRKMILQKQQIIKEI